MYFIGISLVGLFFLSVLVFSVPPYKVNLYWQKPLIFSIFGLICFLGIIAGVFPSKCLKIIRFQKETHNDSFNNAKKEYVEERIIKFKGHHPDCGSFSGHVFRLAGKTYCSGCTGLVIGAIISLFGTFLYLIGGLPHGENGTIIFWLGFAGVFIGLLQHNLFKTRRNFLHLFLNVIFVLGAFMLLIGIEDITSNLLIELYFFILILNWILTRIVLSQREHKNICGVCGLDSCSFFDSS